MLAVLRRANGPGNVQVVGKRVVDGLDVSVDKQFLVAAVRPGNAEIRGGFAASRDAIAITEAASLRCSAGITFCVAILATPSTPHRTRSVTAEMAALRDSLSCPSAPSA
jgi:hypothetical protein